jgi:hypothetical protein
LKKFLLFKGHFSREKKNQVNYISSINKNKKKKTKKNKKNNNNIIKKKNKNKYILIYSTFSIIKFY